MYYRQEFIDDLNEVTLQLVDQGYTKEASVFRDYIDQSKTIFKVAETIPALNRHKNTANKILIFNPLPHFWNNDRNPTNTFINISLFLSHRTITYFIDP